MIATFPSKQYNIDDYPAVKSHLLSYGIERLEQTGKTHIINGKPIKARKKTNNKWFETQDSISYWDDFSKQKIVWGELSDEPKFAIDKEGKFTPMNTVFLMTGEHLLYLLAFLNSPVSKYYFSKNIATTSGVGTVRWLKYTIETLPIPRLNDDMLSLVYSIVNNDEIDNSAINSMVYSTYGFTDKEIKIIEDFCYDFGNF